MQTAISFILDGRRVVLDFNLHKELSPTMSVLQYLRSLPNHKGVKEGCGEGDCGACTVVLGEIENNNHLHYRAVNSCLLFLPMIHGKQLITVENLRDPNGNLHPLQQSLVDFYGSQCGFCTPGIIMSLFALYKNHAEPSRAQINDALSGNLCRCTGYRPIIDAAAHACRYHGVDSFSEGEEATVRLLQTIPQESIHVRMKDQRYFRPASLGEALSLKHQYPEAVTISGATDVALRVTKNHELLREIIDLSGLEELKKIIETESTVIVGSGVPVNDLLPHLRTEYVPLYDMLSLFGSCQIRNLATLGGNIGTASPVSDTLPVLMAYGARVILEGLNGRRELPLNDYFTGYRRTRRKADELITAVVLPRISTRPLVKSYKVSRRHDLDISTLSACFRLDLHGGNVESIVLAYGGMADVPKRASTVERFMVGKPWNRKTLEEAMIFIENDFTPITDVRGSDRFRRIVAQNLLLKFWSETSMEKPQ